MDFGIWTLLPPAIVIVLAIWSKKPVESLLVGCLSAYAIIAIQTKENFITLATDAFFKVATNYDNVWIILVCALFGSLIALMNASNGTMAIAELIGRFCKSAKSILMSAWGLGMLIFIDDYMNIMTISSCMKRVCEKKRIPKATLAYIIDSTGAPACVLVPFSTWAVFYASNFYAQDSVRALGFGTAMNSYIHAIPYMFYAIIALFIVPLFILKIVPVIGPLKREYTGLAAVQTEEVDETDSFRGAHVVDFIVPIGIMICVTIAADDMFIALVAAIVSCFLLYIPRKVLKPSECCDLWIRGIGDLMPTLAVLLFAFYMKQACADIHLPEYVVGKCLPYVSSTSFPVVAFILVSVLAFVTGDSWGVPAICVPIIMPLGAACGANVLLTMGAVVSGGVFCSHACFYSDATVLTSTCCEMDAMTHARTQLPYALIAFFASVVLYLVLGSIM